MQATRLLQQFFSGLYGNISEAELPRLLFIYGFSLVGVVLLPTIAVLHLLLHGSAWLASLYLGVALLTVLNLLWVHSRQAIGGGQNVILLLLFGSLLAGLFAGIGQSAGFWFALFPVAALFLKGLRMGAALVATLLASLLAIAAAQTNGLLQTVLPTENLLLLTASTFTITLICAFCYAVYADMQAQLLARSAELSEELMMQHSVETLLRRSEQQHRFMAHRDPLTGLPNRALAFDRLEQMLKVAHRHRHQAAVILLDLNGFSQLNAAHGHEVGDQVLEALARRLQQRVRDCDTLARSGIDDFMLLVGELGDAKALDGLIRELRALIAQPLTVQGQHLRLEACVGCAVYPGDGETPEALVERADARLFLAKHQRQEGMASTG